ncbi:MAG: putative F420-dependent reductase [Modestobacter sp.]|jgi:predicted dinucleotide-binding enzyme|nr:putative F420-dependent reductase [Modestobacter sp.]MCW2508938.1 putative F420-dependent reductase [Modestobacter sp.]
MTTLGLIGAGHIGSALAQTALDAGWDVVLSNSRGPETLADLVAELAARPTARGTVRAGTAEEAAAAADLAVVTIPVKAIDQVPVDPLTGKVVIDTNNYYPQRDGQIPDLDEARTTSAELLQRHLPGSSVVKAFNHIQAAQIVSERSAPGTGHRRALAIAGDDATAKERVAAFVDELGFDVVDLGTLADSWRIEPGTPGYGAEDDADQLRAHLAAATRG